MTDPLVGLVFLLAGVAAAAGVVRHRARRHAIDPRLAVDALFVVVAAGLCASHVVGALVYRPDALAADWTTLLPGSGTSSSLGAIVGAGLGLAGWLRPRAGRAFWIHVDDLVLALGLGWAIGRVGCFLCHDHLGRLTSFPLGVVIGGGRRHDLGLYEALASFALYGVLVAADRPGVRPGWLAGLAAVGYGAIRFALEPLRADDLEVLGRHSDARYFGWTLVQMAAPALCAVGAAILWRSRGRLARISLRPRRPAAPVATTARRSVRPAAPARGG